jgi:prepilin-type N-terminal cleavage/methylation domain-containing protein
MKIKNIFKSMTGFSLVEVLAAMAVLGVLSTVIMKLMDNANKSAKTIEAKDEISQLQREISDLLTNPNNCEATLGQRTVGSSVPLVYHMVNGVPAVKITPSTAASTKATVQSIEVKSIDMNGDGSQAMGTLDVYFQKPGNALGGREIKKEIKFNANLCAKNLISGVDNPAILTQCSGSGRKLIQGPYIWNSTKWAVCQDCNSAASNPIMTCQSTGGGVDVGNISQLSCVSLGGTFDEPTSQCLFPDVTLDVFIQNKIKALSDSLPQCILTEEACTGLYPNNAGVVYNMTKTGTTSVTTYQRSCYTPFFRKGSACCIASYNAYGGYNSGTCSTSFSTNSNITCGQNGGDSGDKFANCQVCVWGACTGFKGQCFTAGSPQCSTTSTGITQQQGTVPVSINKCCK